MLAVSLQRVRYLNWKVNWTISRFHADLAFKIWWFQEEGGIFDHVYVNDKLFL